mmetsp:Transcript_2436/g.7264  ORF Transcript_2436/g.7264 Transcript_2436/m.7264 type:complete len:313 (-) Transcript_2436:78-1016(-)
MATLLLLLVVVPLSAVVAAKDLEGRRPFLIVSQARSGTTWLGSLLKAHPDVTTPHVEVRERFLEMNETEAHAEYLRFESERRIKPTKVHGFKWFNTEGWLTAVEGGKMKVMGNDNAGVFHELGLVTSDHWFSRHVRRSKVVVLERSGLTHFVSMQKHDVTEVYKCATPKCVEEQRAVKVDLFPNESKEGLRTQLLEYLNGQTTEMTNVITWLRSAADPTDVLIVSYKELVEATGNALRRIFHHVGLDPGLYDWNYVHSQHDVLKMGDPLVRNSILRPDDVAEALQGTIWEGQVDRPECQLRHRHSSRTTPLL